MSQDPDTYSAPLKLSDYAITLSQLEDLAGEHYGKILVAAGDGDPGTVTVEFTDRLHPILETKISGLECINTFLNALDSYRLAKP